MVNPWFKFYGGEYISDPKMLALSACERSCWITLLAYASQSNGYVKHLSEEVLMAQAGVDFMKDEWGETKGVLQHFEELGMVTRDNGVITVCNWGKRQEKSLTPYERVKKYRSKKEDDNVMITPDNEMITDDNANDNARREERRIDKSKKENKTLTHLKFFTSKEFIKSEECAVLTTKHKVSPAIMASELNKFADYWMARNEGGKKMFFEMKKVFDLDRRINTWMANYKNYNPSAGKETLKKICKACQKEIIGGWQQVGSATICSRCLEDGGKYSTLKAGIGKAMTQ